MKNILLVSFLLLVAIAIISAAERVVICEEMEKTGEKKRQGVRLQTTN